MEEIAGHHANAQSLDAALQTLGVVGGYRSGSARVFGIVAGDRIEHDRAILHRARHRTGSVHAPGERNDSVIAHTPVGRSYADHSVDGRRQANRTAGVRADRAVTRPRRDGDARPTARSGGESFRIPGIAHGAVVRIVRGSAPGEFVHVQFAEENGTGATQSFGHRGVVIGYPVLQHFAARGRSESFDREVVLQRDRYAVKGAQIVACHDHGLGRLGDFACFVVEDRYVGRETAVDGFDPIEASADQIDRRNIFRLDEAGGLRQGQFQQLGRLAHVSCPLQCQSDG